MESTAWPPSPPIAADTHATCVALRANRKRHALSDARSRPFSQRLRWRAMPALEVRGLVKRYGAVEALGGVDLDVGEGQPSSPH